MTASVLLLNPKYPHNVGGSQRACALLGAEALYWTGDRVPPPDNWPEGARLPREERMKAYAKTRLAWVDDMEPLAPHPVTAICQPNGTRRHLIPVCVEIVPGAIELDLYEHPMRALYVFGPEDGDVPPGIRRECHHFVRIPTADPDERTPFNLSHAVAMVLQHRLFQQRAHQRALADSNLKGAYV